MLWKTKALAAALVLTVTSGGSLPAQDLAGRWKGRIEPGNHSAEVDLDLRRADGWKAELLFRAGSDAGALPVRELRVDGGSVRVRTIIEGADVSIDLTLANDLLIGSVRVTENERVLAEGAAGLARIADANAHARLHEWLDARGTSIDARRRAAVIERALQLFEANYLSADGAERAVADVRARARRGEYDALSSPARLAELLGRHLSDVAGDGHVRLKFGAERAADPLSPAADTEPDLAQRRRDAAAEQFGIGEPRVLDGNIGYVAFKRFFRAELAGDALAAAMHSLAKTDALIVDLRESAGGDPAMVVLAASWLFDGRPRHWNDMVRRVDGTTTQYWTAAWLPGPRYVGKPVYVLTASRTFSAPESFAYELQQAGRATIVGETTGGGAHSGAWFPVDDRFSLFIPLSRYVSAASGSDWERIGVRPDVACRAAEALDCAHRLARKSIQN